MSSNRELAQQVATDFCEGLEKALPRMANAVESGQSEASFSITFQVKRVTKGRGANRKRRLQATLKPRERIPLELIEYDVRLEDGQFTFVFDYPDEIEE